MRTAVTAMLVVILLTSTSYGKQKDPSGGKRAPRISLHVAALQGNLKAVHQHIKAGSDLNKKDEYGSSPLVVAVTFGRTNVAKVLIDAGADMKVTNNEGSSLLHIAAFFCRTEIVKLLLDKSADKNAKNSAGRTALDTVSGPFEDVRGIYEYFAKTLGPLGLRLDYERIKKTRSRIAEMLR